MYRHALVHSSGMERCMYIPLYTFCADKEKNNNNNKNKKEHRTRDEQIYRTTRSVVY